jgi:hypothetical protein
VQNGGWDGDGVRDAVRDIVGVTLAVKDAVAVRDGDVVGEMLMLDVTDVDDDKEMDRVDDEDSETDTDLVGLLELDADAGDDGLAVNEVDAEALAADDWDTLAVDDALAAVDDDPDAEYDTELDGEAIGDAEWEPDSERDAETDKLAVDDFELDTETEFDELAGGELLVLVTDADSEAVVVCPEPVQTMASARTTHKRVFITAAHSPKDTQIQPRGCFQPGFPCQRYSQKYKDTRET